MAVVIETTLGDITVDLYLDQRPVTCLNFLKLCKMKYYNFNLFHSIRSGFIAQTGDPTGEGSGGQSIFGLLEGPEKRFFSGEKMPKIRHTDAGLLSMVCTGDMMVGSQFFFTLSPDLDSLDGVHCVIGEVTEGHDVLRKLNDVICDESHRPYRDVRVTHTVVLEDPFNDPIGLRAPSRSPSPSAERLKGGRIAPDEEIDETQGKSAAEIQEMIEEKEAKARATILEIVGDLPDADVAPPENVLFVCKLNPVTTDDDLEIIFSRFGKIVTCEVIRDKKTGDSLQYAFIEFADKKSCEDAYFKMDNVLIDDRRIHVDFSQSVSKMKWLGKGRGVKFLDENDEDNNTVPRNDRSKRSQSRGRENNRYTYNNTNHNSRERNRERDNNSDRHNRNEKDKEKSLRRRSRSPLRTERSKNHKGNEYNSPKNNDSRKSDKAAKDNINDSSRKNSYRSRLSPARERREDKQRDYRNERNDRKRSNIEQESRTRDRKEDRDKKVSKHEKNSYDYDEKRNKGPQNQREDMLRNHYDKKHDNMSNKDKEMRTKGRKDERSKNHKIRHNSQSNSQSEDETGDISQNRNGEKARAHKTSENKKEERDYKNRQSKRRNSDAVAENQCRHGSVEKPDSLKDRNDKRINEEMVNISRSRKEEDKVRDRKDRYNRDKSIFPSENTENKKRKHKNYEAVPHKSKKSKSNSENFEPRTPSPTDGRKKDNKSLKNKGKHMDEKKKASKKRRKPSTSSESSSGSSSSSDSSSSSEDDDKKKSLKRRKRKYSTSSTSSSESSSSSSSSSSASSSTSSSSSDSDAKKKKTKKNSNKRKKL